MLLRGHWNDALASLILDFLPRRGHHPDLVRAHSLALAAKRVLDLDAEDFDTIASDVHSRWTDDLVSASFRPEPRDPQRGALGSLIGGTG